MAPGVSFQVIRMEEAWVERVYALSCACFSRPWSRELWMREAAEPSALTLLAVSGEELLGFVNARRVLDEGDLDLIAVRADRRRQGIAGRLLEALFAACRERGVRRLTLEVRVSNAPAIALYEGFGFARAGLRKEYYTGPVEDALLLAREL